MVLSVYLRLLIFLPAILIPACASSSPAFLMMYSVYKLNKQGDNIQPGCTPFPLCNQSVVPCPVLTVASWPAYRFLKRQVRWSGICISFRIFHSLLWSTQLKALRTRYLLGQALVLDTGLQKLGIHSPSPWRISSIKRKGIDFVYKMIYYRVSFSHSFIRSFLCMFWFT